MADEGVEIEDYNVDLESQYIERETQEEENSNLYMAISKLTPRQREMVRMIYFEGKSQEEVRNYFGIAKSSMAEAMQRIHNALRKILESK